MPINAVCATGNVVVGVRICPIDFELPSGVIHLVEEAVVRGIARGGIGAGKASGVLVLSTQRPVVGNEALLFLEQDDEHLRVDTTSLGNIVDNLCGCSIGPSRECCA